ncbi:hypothetical protein JWG44_01720 [Leptospira sp. 201903071]|uniref:MORN repeat-containing protein n=1 Tax=Leptospira ainazelensis TaxID=2810034 RepID=UPI00196355D4|nr:hypothetical protein [Leptospira ainazelensis]
MYPTRIITFFKTAVLTLKRSLQRWTSTKKGKLFFFLTIAFCLFVFVTAFLKFTKYKCLTESCENGFAKIQYRGGAYYEGYVRNSHPDGYGLFKNEEGHFYKGEWKHGVKHGDGSYRYPDGSSYSGTFVNNKKQGLGVFGWRDGTTLSVRWNEDEPDGAGLLILSDGTKLSGIYKSGRIYDGNGAFIYPDGNVYIGSWRAGKREGFGILRNESGQIIHKGNWKNDKEAFNAN